MSIVLTKLQSKKMKKQLICAVAGLALASCSSDSLVGESPVNNEAPIAFTAGQRNITRTTTGTPLEESYNDFGVWAYKTRTAGDPTKQLVMDNYQVGYKKEANKTVWYYEGLGTDAKQILHYWDLSYTNTNFYAYAPYNTAVTISGNTITVPSSVNKAGDAKDVVYAGAQALNSDKAKPNTYVSLQFKHLGAKVNLKFYEDIPGYSVELIEVTKGGNDIQATPAVATVENATTTYTKGQYLTDAEATISYNESMVPTADVKNVGTLSDANLVFNITENTNDSKLVPSAVNTGVQGYLESPTTYYAVAQPKTSTTGFTFHVSYKLTAEDGSGEVIYVRDARVFVPASTGEGDSKTYIAAWQPNTKYTYTFKITKNTNGSTGDTDPSVSDPAVPATPALYPIIFDDITIVDYENEVPYSKEN